MEKRKISRRVSAIAAVLAVVLLSLSLVWGIGALSGRYTRFDMSAEAYYTLSDESRDVLDGIDKEVELVLLAVEGSEDLTVQYLLQRYADMCERITFRCIDPAENSELAAQYAPDLRYSNSIAVISGERRCLVEPSELYESDYSAYMQSGNTADIKSAFRAESAVTGAIRYVTSNELPRLYFLSGHEELGVGESISRGLRHAGILTTELDLSTGDVPADADAILIHAPSFDISAAEREKLAAYLENGGQMILITAYSGEPLQELAGLMEVYGCRLSEGLVVEQDREHYAYGYYDCLIPIAAEHELMKGIGDGGIVMPGSQAILFEETDGVSMTSLLTSSQAAYASTDLGSIGKKDGDLSGPLTVAALLEKGESRVIWFASGFMLDENYGEANGDLFLESVSYLCGSAATDIPAKNIAGAGMLRMDGPQAMVMGALFTLIVPLLFVVIGAVVLIRRRRRA